MEQDQDHRNAACGFLLHHLAAGPKPSEELKTLAKAEGITDITLRRARERLGVVAYKGAGYLSRWFWRLPEPGF